MVKVISCGTDTEISDEKHLASAAMRNLGPHCAHRVCKSLKERRVLVGVK